MKTTTRAASILWVAAFAAAGVGAQEPDSLALLQAIAATDSNAVVRVQTVDGRLISGVLSAGASGGILVASGEQGVTVPYADVGRYWERRRATRAGGIVVGVLGAGVGVAFGAILGSICDTCGPGEEPVVSTAIMVGGFLGLAGVGVGSVIGSAIPRWSLQWESPSQRGRPVPRSVARVPSAGTQSSRRRIGELSLQLAGGYGRVKEDLPPEWALPTRQGAEVGVIASLAFRSGRFSLGPELLVSGGPNAPRALSGLMRYELSPDGDGGSAAYVLLGLGSYEWRYEKLTTMPVGLGLRLGADRDWLAEVRWHPSIEHGSVTRPTLATLSVGRRVAW